MSKKPIGIGYEDFRELIQKNFYYVDKTYMIQELLDHMDKVNLFARPRRFGKTLNLSMIRRFFELELDLDGKQMDNHHLFKGLAIASCGESYLAHQQQYPVIHLSLKSAKQPTYEMACEALISDVIMEYKRHGYVMEEGRLTEADQKKFYRLLQGDGSAYEYAAGLAFLSYCLEQYHKKKVIILIDEYDVPLENAWFSGFYEDMTAFIRSLFESALKTNPYLEFAVITGCLRISKESIFTGLNNVAIHSILGPGYTDSFGFTEQEVKDLLSCYGLEDKYSEVQNWYDGYRFGQHEIYNPWSIINYVKAAVMDRNTFPRTYWSNTSSNSIIRELVETEDMGTKEEIETLIAGKSIEKPIHEDITYGEIHESRDNLWNFLYFTGYLKKTGERLTDEVIYLTLAIPNTEVRSIYRSTILTWFDKRIVY